MNFMGMKDGERLSGPGKPEYDSAEIIGASDPQDALEKGCDYTIYGVGISKDFGIRRGVFFSIRCFGQERGGPIRFQQCSGIIPITSMGNTDVERIEDAKKYAPKKIFPTTVGIDWRTAFGKK